MAERRLPKWADEWTRGTCGCGAKLCLVHGYGGTHTVCSASGWAPELCNGGGSVR